MNELLIKIQSILPDLNPTELRIANYFLENQKEIFNIPISAIADKCGTSQSALVRFCKKLGYSGLKEFKSAIADNMALRLEQDSIVQYPDISGSDKVEDILKKVCSNNTLSILGTQEILDTNELKKAIIAVDAAKRVDFYGVGASGLVAMDAQQKFLRIGKICNVSVDPHMQIVTAASLTEKDVAVFISNSGMTRDVLESFDCAKKTGATTIAITSYRMSPLSAEADIKLWISSTESNVRSGAMGSRIAQLTVIDAMFTGVAGRNLVESLALLEASHKQMAVKKLRVRN